MENSELLNTVRRSPLSPDTQIEVQASRSEFARVGEILEEEGAKYPRLHPLHGERVGQLLNQISRAVERTPGLNEDIKDRLSIATDIRNTRDNGATPTTRNWDGPHGDRGKRPSSKYYATIEEKRAAIQVANVVLETYRLQDEATPPDTLLNPTRSFTIVDGGGFVGGQVPADLAEITLGDCIPTHVINGNNIEAIPVNFFHQNWFESSFALPCWKQMERVEDKCKVQLL
ncbi:hypothetical protein V1522DRAFT_439057 [Lipomyces starkeyi]